MPNAVYFVRRAGEIYRDRGVREVAHRVLSRALDYSFDWRHGTDTRREVSLDDLRADAPFAEQMNEYSATRARALRRLLATLELSPGGTFLDLGAGKGRALLIAAEFGFTRVVGVELAPTLVRIARRNAAVYRRRRPGLSPIEVCEGDATCHRIADDVTVVFLYNPFGEPLLRAVLDNVAASLARRPRDLHVVYNNPVCEHVLRGEGLFDRSGEYRFSAQRFVVFRSVPAAVASRPVESSASRPLSHEVGDT